MAKGDAAPELTEYFSGIRDPRRRGSRIQHRLLDILVIAVCGVLCGVEGWEDLELFGEAKKEWFETFLELSNGIPSHDTFARVFAMLDVESFQSAFIAWTQAVAEVTEGELIAIDGKSLRRSFDKAAGRSALHIVSAWAGGRRLSLGQVAVDAKSNEITAVPKLLEMLNVKGCVVSLDAMGCQKEIAEKIIEKEADYVLALKGNHGDLKEEVEAQFESCIEDGFKDMDHEFTETTEKDHGRIEIRKYWTIMNLDWLSVRGFWKDIATVTRVESTRIIKDEQTQEIRYYISSLKEPSKVPPAIRGHWGIENSLHWCLDVAMNEDQCRIRNKKAPVNFALLRKMGINMLKRETLLKRGIRAKQKNCGWNHQYLLTVLFGSEKVGSYEFNPL